MAAEDMHHKLEMELVAKLARVFPGMTVEVAHSRRWNRMCVTFRWGGFTPLLPEERFHRLVTVLPEKFRQQSLEGFVWLELAPGESIEDFLRLPRSDDVADKEGNIHDGLVQVGFFKTLGQTLGSPPKDKCPGDFSKTVEVLSARQFSSAKIAEAKLLFIRHGAYCDCQVLQSVQSALDGRHAGAA